ncbi:MAG: ATP-dependent helicase, partial [Planctomycetaceae bacterium]
RNCLFLTTQDESLLQAAAIVDLWHSGYVEPVVPPCEPYHVLAQQLLALVLQERGVGRRSWWEWVARVPGFQKLPASDVERMLEWMLSTGVLWEEQGILGMGRTGEETFGRRNFMELLSVFLSPPLFTVLHGRDEIGFVDELTFHAKSAGPRVLLLGGRAWLVTYVDWGRKVAFVEPSEHRGLSRWQGDCRSLSYRVCQAIRTILAGEDERPWWSNRARE